ncbi:MAG: HpcH/HpaI aldolase family protein [Pontibacterium sp.]
MHPNHIKNKWESGQATINGWLSIGNPFTAEIMSAQGYDSVTIDIQHGALDYSSALPMLQAMRASGVFPMARVPWLDAAAIMKTLDAGAMGIICPMINNKEDAQEFVSYVKYPPIGQRSFGPTRAAVAMPGYGIQANEHVLALAMIETPSGVENLEEIVATEGVDGIYVGPADLTLGTQEGRLPPGFDREEEVMIELIQRIVAVCKKYDKFACLHCGTPEYAAKAVGWGFNMTTVSGDSRLLAAAASSTVSTWRGLMSEQVLETTTEQGGGY